MGFRYWYKDPDGDITEIPDRVRRYEAELVTNAEEGGVGDGKVPLSNSGSFMIRGHRLFVVTETEASGDDFGGVVYVGYTANRKQHRRYERTLAQNELDINIVDLNTLLSDRILHGQDCDRHEETDLQRIGWLLGTAEMGPVLDDTTFVADSDPEMMDAYDYAGSKPIDVVDDCGQQSGRNYFLLWQDSGGVVPNIYLWYRRGTGSFWQSSIRLSNDLTEIDDEVTFEPAFDTTLDRDPGRVYSNIRENYDGGFVLEARDSTATRFRRRWTTGQAERVHTEAKARRRAQRTLRDIDVEEDTIETAVRLPRALVNSAMAGQLISVHFTHLDGYEAGFVDMRIVDRTVREINPDIVELALTLEADQPNDTDANPSANAYAVLDYAHGPYTGGLVRFAGSGDDPPGGWISHPTIGLLTPLSDSNARPFYGIQVDGDGTIDVRFHCSITGVLTKPVVYTVTWSITVNGADVASSSVNYDNSGGGLHGMTGTNTVEAAGLAVSNGDVVGARLSVSPFVFAFFKTPAGTGTGGEVLEITDGSLS